MRIRLTQERDLPAIDQIFALGRERQHSEGNYSQWREDYPTIAVVREDIKNGTGFVCVDDDDSTVLGTWALEDYEAVYAHLKSGAWSAPHGHYARPWGWGLHHAIFARELPLFAGRHLREKLVNDSFAQKGRLQAMWCGLL